MTSSLYCYVPTYRDKWGCQVYMTERKIANPGYVKATFPLSTRALHLRICPHRLVYIHSMYEWIYHPYVLHTGDISINAYYMNLWWWWQWNYPPHRHHHRQSLAFIDSWVNNGSFRPGQVPLEFHWNITDRTRIPLVYNPVWKTRILTGESIQAVSPIPGVSAYKVASRISKFSRVGKLSHICTGSHKHPLH